VKQLPQLVFALIGVIACHLAIAGELGRTPIKIVTYQPRGDRWFLSMQVEGATRSSQVVVLVRSPIRPGLWPAANEYGKPAMPLTAIDLLPSDQTPAAGTVSNWIVEFHNPIQLGGVSEIYAIVCHVREREGWSRSRDYQGFVYLPFGKVGSIEEAFRLLDEFGWTPTGYTAIRP
jgi:hypothetical protein